MAMNDISIENCKVIELPKMSDPRGNLTFVENSRHIPFAVKRVFYIYDVPEGASRGAHAHKELHQFLICLSGSFDVLIDDGINQKIFHLQRPNQGLHIPPMLWAAEVNFSQDSVCLVLTSDYYDESDYYRNYDDYLAAKLYEK
jgi:dTDP-4-dehydrorhamnose 3,5-epimerase-like enzyme